MNVIDVNLDLLPHERWQGLGTYTQQINELGEQILRDVLPHYKPVTALGFKLYRKIHGNQEYLSELAGMSQVTGYSYERLCLLNYYYDLLKVYFDGISCFGCSAFAVDTPNGPIHVRNLDWPSDGGILGHYSLQQNFYRNGQLLYTAIGWPAYNSVLSGCAPGRFSITLNTVSSREKAQWAKSVTYLIRDVFENCLTYDQAVKKLSETKIMSDCILTVCGAKTGEFCVIERSPTRFQIRYGNKWVAATNDYRTSMAEHKSLLNEMISGDSCSRYAGLERQINNKLPGSLTEGLSYVKHHAVKNDITMQHMAFSAASGEVITENGKASVLTKAFP